MVGKTCDNAPGVSASDSDAGSLPWLVAMGAMRRRRYLID
jgi:hypothetical protein